ncbi:hypothetical protein ASE86_08095 [Sphingomonas sp. Leaf33]|uniref:hypothetical protein n=1 Tax=Sphingomonas sp. Leaf33 TaxID=1736215 RepID=UPI0006FFF837|nr:hypothetical protein [Sphingomonas sp. Leaf33]KQN26107.1 hypothetical protein ASE86_08095 [Sphingomonas sp. Leaf33]
MRLTTLQALWLIGATVLAALLSIDVFGLVHVPFPLWGGLTGLLIISGRVMPSLHELQKADSRG